jgi:hypothetical protein
MEAFELARQTLLLLAPLVAQGGLAKVGEDTNDRVTQLIGQAWGLLRGATHGTPKAESALEVFQDEPDDQRNLERLAQHMATYLNQHHQVIAELHELVTQLQQQTQQAGAQVTFTNSGENHGQQIGVNHGTITQSRQDIHNHASNQGAQGSFPRASELHPPGGQRRPRRRYCRRRHR